MKYLDQISQLNIEMFFSLGQTGPFLTINAVRDFWNGAVKDGAGRNTHKRPLQKTVTLSTLGFFFFFFSVHEPKLCCFKDQSSSWHWVTSWTSLTPPPTLSSPTPVDLLPMFRFSDHTADRLLPMCAPTWCWRSLMDPLNCLEEACNNLRGWDPAKIQLAPTCYQGIVDNR